MTDNYTEIDRMIWVDLETLRNLCEDDDSILYIKTRLLLKNNIDKIKSIFEIKRQE